MNTAKANAKVFRDDAGEYRWRLQGANGEIVAQSEGYTRKADALRGLRDAAKAMKAAVHLDPDPPSNTNPEIVGEFQRRGRKNLVA